MALFTETADVSVRPAVEGDQDIVTDIQMTAWATTHGEVLGPDVLELLDVDKIRQQWAEAITSPPGPGFAVLVALDGPRIIGFAAVAPAQLIALEVLPEFQRQGHGSRLLSAAADRLRQSEAEEIIVWVLDQDTARESFLEGAGLRPDGRQRSLAAGAREVTEARWSALL